MQTVIYLNKWHANLFHVILAVHDEEIDYILASRVCTTLDEARRLSQRWQQQHAVGVEDVRDNSALVLSELLAGIEPTDFSPTHN